MQEEAVLVKEESKETPVKLTRKEKRHNRLRKKYFKEKDIKYRGPLSYRYLRILAWLCLAITQFLILNSLASKLLGFSIVGTVDATVISYFADIATPLFLIASFGLILSGKKTYKNYLLLYGGMFLALGGGLCIFFGRYIHSLLASAGVTEEGMLIIGSAIGQKLQLNVFSDLFLFVSFHFFMNYNPKRIFVDKKRIIFRLFMIFPIAYVIASYILKILSVTGTIMLPFYVYPFMCTKSPLVLLVFVCLSFWIKVRERWFIKLGATEEQYQKFLKTNRNSLSYSIQLSIIVLIAAVIDILFLIGFLVWFAINGDGETQTFMTLANAFGIGSGLSLTLAIPFILLYSYTRDHKNGLIDLFLPIIGIAAIALIYLEVIYQVIMNLLSQLH